MSYLLKLILVCCVIPAAAMAAAAPGDSGGPSDEDRLKITALEVLMAAPQERALPIVARVLEGNDSDAVKSRALFVLSQIDLPEAHGLLLDTARSSTGELQMEAIRMLGISGDPTALAGLNELYRDGSLDLKKRVLQAFLIAGDTNSVYELAVDAQSDEEFRITVQTLGAMGATEELRRLRDQGGNAETLIHAYSIAGDDQSLREMAMDSSDLRAQIASIQNLGVIGGGEANETLLEIYRNSASNDVRNAALRGMMISGYDEGLIEIFRASDNSEEKRMLLHMLMSMESDAALDIIDATLAGEK
jgi:HEAT repeat protein